MRRWRDDAAPGVSIASITFAAFAAALVRTGLGPVGPGAVFVTESQARPGLRAPGRTVRWGPYLAPLDLTDPLAVHGALADAPATRRMLTVLAARGVRTGQRGMAAMPHPRRRGGRPRAQLTFSDQGSHEELAALPWAGGARINISAGAWAEPAGITLVTSRLCDVLHMDVSFHRSTYDPRQLRRALDMLRRDPVGLLATDG
jgi:hypothetical protein